MGRNPNCDYSGWRRWRRRAHWSSNCGCCEFCNHGKCRLPIISDLSQYHGCETFKSRSTRWSISPSISKRSTTLSVILSKIFDRNSPISRSMSYLKSRQAISNLVASFIIQLYALQPIEYHTTFSLLPTESLLFEAFMNMCILTSKILP